MDFRFIFLLIFPCVYNKKLIQNDLIHDSHSRVINLLEDMKSGQWHHDVEDVILPSKEEITELESSQLASLYHRYINSLQILCKNIIRLGRVDDGGWDICDDVRYRPGANCLVYSFGIDYDFSFDDDVSKKYGCEVHSFDPSMDIGNQKHALNVYYHHAGLSDRKEIASGYRWQMNTFNGFREALDHSKRPVDILKLDIEQWEWLALKEMIASKALTTVKHLIIEFHVTVPKTEPSSVEYRRSLSILKDLYDIGFRIIWTHRNLFCKYYSVSDAIERTGCHEVSFVNIKSVQHA